MLSQQSLEAFAATRGLGHDQYSLIQALQSISCPADQLMLWVGNPGSIPEPYCSAIADEIAHLYTEDSDDDGAEDSDDDGAEDSDDDGAEGSEEGGPEEGGSDEDAREEPVEDTATQEGTGADNGEEETDEGHGEEE